MKIIKVSNIYNIRKKTLNNILLLKISIVFYLQSITKFTYL